MRPWGAGRRPADVKGRTNWVQLDFPRPVSATSRRAFLRELRRRYGDAAFYSHPLVVGNNCIPNVHVRDIDAEYERMKPLASKITDGVQNVGPFRLFMFADPDGNVLEFYCRDPSAAQ